MAMDYTVDNIKKFLLGILFPSFCLGCQKEGFLLCQDCKSILEISEYNYCLCSKNPLRLASFDFTQDKSLAQGKPQGKPFGVSQGKCYRCKDKKLSGLYFALPYKEKALTKKLIYQFKYKPHLKTLAKTLTGIIVEHLVITKCNTDAIWKDSILVPVPLEKSKLKSRGYNQAEELSKELSKIIKVPVLSGNLIKIKETLSQTKLSAKEREENLKGAFLVRNSSEFAGKKVFLVDDVYTTGFTMEECTRVLKETKAKSVWGIVIAREG